MPFTEDGIRPDLIINPHAIPSRMTIGQIVESLFGKVCTSYGAFGDCTAFQVKGSNYTTYAPLLVRAGFNSTGNQVLYNGMTGEQLGADIYIGPTYYMRLKHMVKDKINYRARGPNTVLTRQPVQGRANDGGLRIGEMERDGVLAHGMSYFLNESFMVRGEKNDFFVAVCNKTGAIAIYNESKNLFLSPYADGPITFVTNPDGSQNIKNLSKFGRSFSILRIPYSLKLLIQELQVMNVQMRIITEDNIDQLLSMSFSNNITKLMDLPDNTELKDVIDKYVTNIKEQQYYVYQKDSPRVTPELPEPVKIESEVESPPYAPYSPAYAPSSDEIYESYNPDSPQYMPGSPAYVPNSNSNKSDAVSPAYIPSDSPTAYNPNLPVYQPVLAPVTPPPAQIFTPQSPTSPPPLIAITPGKTENLSQQQNLSGSNILEIEQPKDNDSSENTDIDSNKEDSNGEKKIINTEQDSSSSSNSGGTRKIIL
jgi:hypothetical protein